MITACMALNKEALHQAVIKHWKVNEEKYSSFTKIEKFHQEINLFERDNSISQTLSCTLPLVVANVLQTPVVILTNVPHIPIISLCSDNHFSEKICFGFCIQKVRFNLRFAKVSMQWKKQRHPHRHRHHHQTTKTRLYVFIMSRTRFRVNPHSIFA